MNRYKSTTLRVVVLHCAPPPWCGSCMRGRELALTQDRAVWCSVLPSPAFRSTKTSRCCHHLPPGGGSRAVFRSGLVNTAATCRVFSQDLNGPP